MVVMARSRTTHHPTTQEDHVIPVHTELGRDLPELAWWHGEEDDPKRLTERFKAPSFDGCFSKPDGGLYTAVLRDFGNGLPDSQWAQYNDRNSVKDHPYVSTVVPEADARFVVVDSQADAVAAAQAFPAAPGSGLLARVLDPDDLAEFKARVPDPSSAMAGLLGYGDRQPPLVDFTLLEQHQYAGVYLTARGMVECQWGSADFPSFRMWDVETVWFRAPELRVTGTSRWVSV
jgi:hypothetical protein